MKINTFLLVITMIYLVFLFVLGFRFRGRSITYQDRVIRDFFIRLPLPRTYSWMQKITKMANVETVMIITIPLFYVLHSQDKYVELSSIILATSLSIFVTHTTKYIFRRLRPQVKKAINYFGYSFPSGHAATGMAFYLTLAYVLLNGYTLFYLMVGLSFLLGIAIGISRIVLGVHWFTDVVFGSILGLISAFWGIYAYEVGFYFPLLMKRI